MTDDRSVLDRTARPPDAVLAYGDEPEQRIDVFHPDRGAPGPSATAEPVVVLIHGGYWRPQWDRAHMAPMAQALAAGGRTVASIEYRRRPGDPDAMTADVSAAVRAAVEEFDRPVVLAGFSAGGHLALWCAAQPGLAPLITHVVALAPVADLRVAESRDLDEGAVRALLGEPAAQRPDLDPVLLTPLVPVHLVHDPQDGLVPIALSEAYAERHGATLDATTGGHFALVDPEHPAWLVVASRIHAAPGAGTMPS